MSIIKNKEMKKETPLVDKKKISIKDVLENKHPLFTTKRTFGQRTADALTKGAGSWVFILSFIIFLIAWMIFNGYYVIKIMSGQAFDPYPFILLNLVLSCLAAFQAPIILMSQNRDSQKERIKAQYDYAVNRKTEQEVRELKDQVIEIRNLLVGKRNSGRMR